MKNNERKPTANKRFERKGGKVLRLNIFGKRKVLSSHQSRELLELSVKIRHKRQAAKTLAVIVTNDRATKNKGLR